MNAMSASDFVRRSWPLALTSFLALLPGCNHSRPAVRDNQAELADYAHAMMPRKIEIQRYLTKPVSYAGNGDADGLEVILAAVDSLGDPTKAVGTFHFELHKFRPADADRVGDTIAFFEQPIRSDEDLAKYWDRYAHYYRFPLKLTAGPLKPGKYILIVRLVGPIEDKLFDQYEFSYESGTAVSAIPNLK
jgi:hypothetical protein